jgi:hypothetical protein
MNKKSNKHCIPRSTRVTVSAIASLLDRKRATEGVGEFRR